MNWDRLFGEWFRTIIIKSSMQSAAIQRGCLERRFCQNRSWEPLEQMSGNKPVSHHTGWSVMTECVELETTEWKITNSGWERWWGKCFSAWEQLIYLYISVIRISIRLMSTQQRSSVPGDVCFQVCVCLQMKMSVCLYVECISPEPITLSPSHFACVLLRAREGAVLNLVQSILINFE